MKKSKKVQSGIFPLPTMTNKKWWEKNQASENLTKGGAVATQEQCSSGTGACNNTCGTRGK